MFSQHQHVLCSVIQLSSGTVMHANTDLAFKLDNKHLVDLILLDFSF